MLLPNAISAWRGVEKVGQRPARACGQRLVGLDAGRERPVRIGIVVNQVVGHRFDDRTGDLGAARAIEIGNPLSLVRPFQRREARANLVGRRDGDPGRSGGGLGHEVIPEIEVVSRFRPQVSTLKTGILTPGRRG